jgi:hypothetical protein
MAALNPAEGDGFLRAKNPQHAFLRSGSKAVGPITFGMLKITSKYKTQPLKHLLQQK